jgi:hypothetical protein
MSNDNYYYGIKHDLQQFQRMTHGVDFVAMDFFHTALQLSYDRKDDIKAGVDKSKITTDFRTDWLSGYMTDGAMNVCYIS